MTAEPQPTPEKAFRPIRRLLPLSVWEAVGTGTLNIFAFGLLGLYLFPILYMVSVAFMSGPQLGDRYAPAYPGELVTFTYEGDKRQVYQVPLADGIHELAIITPGRTSSTFIDPANPGAGLIDWEGSWRSLPRVYRFKLHWENFSQLIAAVKFPLLLRNTLLAATVSEIGVLLSSILVAYGFARHPLPGGNTLFYIMIATLLIPEKVTLIPTYFFFARVLDWEGSWLPILLPFFFGNAIYIFLLRQNFKIVPRELEEAAMLDGAGPLRTLFSIVLPQAWPAVITVSLLHFFYIWNETRLASLYLSIRRDLIPVSFGIANFQSLAFTQNLTQASSLIIMLVPVVIILLSQRVFLKNMVITGTERGK